MRTETLLSIPPDDEPFLPVAHKTLSDASMMDKVVVLPSDPAGVKSLGMEIIRLNKVLSMYQTQRQYA